jgi:hypothetical protein
LAKKTYSDEVKAISREKGVDLGVAQSMYNTGTRASSSSSSSSSNSNKSTTSNTNSASSNAASTSASSSKATSTVGTSTGSTSTNKSAGSTSTNKSTGSTSTNKSTGYYSNGTYNTGTYNGSKVTGTGGSYSIGSDTGKSLLNTLASGGKVTSNSAYTVNSDGSVTTKDGATWKSNGDGTVTVVSSGGSKTTFGSKTDTSNTSSGSSSKDSTTTNTTKASATTPATSATTTTPATSAETATGTYKFNTAKGNDVYNEVASGGTATITNGDGTTADVYLEDGVVYVKNNTTGKISRAENLWNQAEHTDTTSDIAKAIASGSALWQVGEDGKAPADAKVGDYVLTGGGLYRIGANGGELVDASTTTSNYDGRWGTLSQAGQTTSTGTTVTDVAGNAYNMQTDANGNLVGITNADGTAVSDGLLKLRTDNGTTPYIVSTDAQGNQTYHKATSTGTQLIDANTGKAVTFTDASGHSVSAGDLYLCDDDVVRSGANGRAIQDLSTDVEGASSYVVEINGQYYSVVDGTNVTDQVDPTLWASDWTANKNEMVNSLLSTLRDQGYINAPQRSDYTDKELTWEQALSQASNQLGATYDASLNNTLDSLNRQALETGFYGQLPTEALRQQAAAAAEVDKQAAIYDLANDLMSNSRDYAEQLFNDDTQTNQDRLNVLTQVIDYLYDDYANDLSKAESQQEADAITADHQQAMLNYAIAAMEAGIPVSTLNEYLGKISA